MESKSLQLTGQWNLPRIEMAQWLQRDNVQAWGLCHGRISSIDSWINWEETLSNCHSRRNHFLLTSIEAIVGLCKLLEESASSCHSLFLLSVDFIVNLVNLSLDRSDRCRNSSQIQLNGQVIFHEEDFLPLLAIYRTVYWAVQWTVNIWFLRILFETNKALLDKREENDRARRSWREGIVHRRPWLKNVLLMMIRKILVWFPVWWEMKRNPLVWEHHFSDISEKIVQDSFIA